MTTLDAVQSISNRRTREQTILLVEDCPDDALITKRQLRKSKFTVLHAYTGPEAVSLFRAFPTIDLVLMDLNLPGMNGVEAAKSMLAYRSSVPICVLTGSFMDENPSVSEKCVVEALALGLTVIPKPLDVPRLLKVFSSLTGAERNCFAH